MLRRAVLAFGLVVSVCSLILPFAADAQPTGKVWRVGYLGNTPTTDPDAGRTWAAFRQELQERGYVERKNLAFELRFAEGRPERYPALVADLVRLNVDVIVALTNPAAHAAKEATATIPIVMISVDDPVGTGLIASLSHPIGNMTGVADYELDLIPKRLELLKAALPTASRVAFIRCLKCAASNEVAKEDARKSDWTTAGRNLGLTLAYVDLSASEDLEIATAAALRVRPDALLLEHSPIHFILRKELAEFATRQRLPMFALLREQVAAGALMSYGPSVSDQFRKAAIYVDKILKGAKPADLPIEQPTKLELVINLKTAKAIGLAIPQTLLLRADEVIQ